MEQDNRGRDGRSQKDPGDYSYNMHQAPTGFEGMNFEQQRSAYRSRFSGRRDDTGGGNNSGRRTDDQ
ncbi:MAG: hypothetical protein ICV66_06895 [Chitinophagaceae bacterium]|nr:hypothetical protein [Chitinophagaceae bacterium]